MNNKDKKFLHGSMIKGVPVKTLPPKASKTSSPSSFISNFQALVSKLKEDEIKRGAYHLMKTLQDRGCTENEYNKICDDLIEHFKESKMEGLDYPEESIEYFREHYKEMQMEEALE